VSASLFLYDAPEDAGRFLPLALSRPIGELRYGASLLRERWAALLGRPVAGHLAAPHLAHFVEPDAPGVVRDPGDVGTARLLFRSTFVPDSPAAIGAVGNEQVRFVDEGGETVGVSLPSGCPWDGLAKTEGWPAATVPGRRLAGVWQLVGDLPTVLAADLERLAAEGAASTIPRGSTVLGDPALLRTDGAVVEPHVVFDVRQGPIALEPGVEVRAFTRLAGPLAVAQGARLVGGMIGGSTIGPRCVVHGEVSSSVFLGYANKAHDGFVGHSVIGRWVNLGAGTVTSNLKNTYGPVRVTLDGTRHETGLVNLGALIGDHVKTAIGTMLPTGCVIGIGANLFGSRRPDPVVPPFAWGLDEPDGVLECGRFLEIAARVLPRRDVAVDEATRRYLAAVWAKATGGAPCA
jgi:UDP-N-acetylglucosamine diphosphorylase/glucosamine-1-phosphate N-acetyltransferase